MGYWTVKLTCGCEINWEEPARTGDLPHIGHYAWCDKHGDQEIADVEPRQWVWAEALLTPEEPRQHPSPYGGYQAGEYLKVAWDTRSASWMYWFEGVSPSGLAFETDAVDGFASAEEALNAGLEQAEQARASS
jgi:hypothetical protein